MISVTLIPTQDFFSEMGFDAMFFSRMDEDDKKQRKKDQAMTFLWRPGKENFGI
jgi:hypothetical protein